MCGGPPDQRGGVDSDLVMATTQVLSERVPRTTTLAVRAVFKARIGRSRAFSLPMVALDPVVLVLADVMPAGRNQILDHLRQRRCPVVEHLGRLRPRTL